MSPGELCLPVIKNIGSTAVIRVCDVVVVVAVNTPSTQMSVIMSDPDWYTLVPTTYQLFEFPLALKSFVIDVVVLVL
jgi:hypothetical protein